jgi:hypothetical protein
VNPRIPAGDVLSLAQEQTDDSYYGFAEEHGADIIPVDDNKSFAVWYQPDDFAGRSFEFAKRLPACCRLGYVQQQG